MYTFFVAPGGLSARVGVCEPQLLPRLTFSPRSLRSSPRRNDLVEGQAAAGSTEVALLLEGAKQSEIRGERTVICVSRALQYLP